MQFSSVLVFASRDFNNDSRCCTEFKIIKLHQLFIPQGDMTASKYVAMYEVEAYWEILSQVLNTVRTQNAGKFGKESVILVLFKKCFLLFLFF